MANNIITITNEQMNTVNLIAFNITHFVKYELSGIFCIKIYLVGSQLADIKFQSKSCRDIAYRKMEQEIKEAINA